jgi:hypothetical protein
MLTAYPSVSSRRAFQRHVPLPKLLFFLAFICICAILRFVKNCGYAADRLPRFLFLAGSTAVLLAPCKAFAPPLESITYEFKIL